MRIGTMIRNTREDLDLSQNDMAKLIPMNQSNYSKIERDVQEPSLDQLKRICEILHIDPKILLGIGKKEDNRLITVSQKDLELLNDAKAFIKKHENK